MFVVHDLVPDIDRGPVFLQSAIHDLDGADHAGAEPARLREHDADGRSLFHRHPEMEFEWSCLAMPHAIRADIHAECRKNLGDDAVPIQTGTRVHRRRRVVIDEDVGQDERTHLEAVLEQAVLGKQVQDVGTEAADRPFLDRDQDFMLARQALDQVGIERFGKPRVRHRRRQPERREFFRGARTFGKAGSEREKCNLAALADNSALADLEGYADLRHVHPDPVAARIAEGGRAVVDGRRRGDHVNQFGLVRGGHEHEPGEATEIGDVERAGMSWSIGADEPGTVDGEAHRQR